MPVSGFVKTAHSGVEVRPIRPDDRAAVDELHRNHYWRSHCLLLNPDFYHWQFGPTDRSLVAVDERGQLLLYFGAVGQSATCLGRPVQGAHVISWLAAPEARGRGLGTLVTRTVTEQYDYVLARSPSAAGLAIFRQLGFRYVKNCPRWVAVLDAASAVRLAVEPADAGARRAAVRAERTESGPYSSAATCPLWAEAAARAALGDSTTFARTTDYFRWRYEQHPTFRYEFVWSEGRTDGIAVARVEDVSGREGRVLRVVEFLAAPGGARNLAKAVFGYGRAGGCAFADVFGFSERFVAGWVAAGGFATFEEPELRLPHLFQPWDASTDTPGFSLFGRGAVDDLTRVHFSRGDGNMDWPSWVPTASGAPYAPPTRFAA